jgi:ribose 5-phosphate isomerase A
VVPFEGVAEVDLVIDGADEIDGALRAIKGGGGALLREKIVGASARRMVVAVDSSKLVERLGRVRLPIEVLPFAATFVERAVTALGVAPARRIKDDATPFLTDQGNYVFDIPFASIPDPADLATRLEAVPGIIGHGLFLCEIDIVFVGRGTRVDTLTRPSGSRGPR